MKLKTWKIFKTRDLFVIKPWIKISKDKIELPDGSVVNDFYRIQLPEYVMIYAQKSARKVLFARQYKHALRAIILSLPAGYIRNKETPLRAAKREFLEETGYLAHKWKFMGSFLVDGNRGCGKANFFIAEKIEKIAEPIQDKMEESDIVFMDPRQALKEILNYKVSLLGIVTLLLIALRNKHL